MVEIIVRLKRIFGVVRLTVENGVRVVHMILLIVVFLPLDLFRGAGGESSPAVTVFPICRGANMIIARPLPWGLFLKRPTSVTLVVVSLPLFWCEVYHWFEVVLLPGTHVLIVHLLPPCACCCESSVIRLGQRTSVKEMLRVDTHRAQLGLHVMNVS